MKTLAQLTNIESALISGGICLCICKNRKSAQLVYHSGYEIIESASSDYNAGIMKNEFACHDKCVIAFTSSEYKKSSIGDFNSEIEDNPPSETSDSSISRIQSAFSTTAFEFIFK